MRVCCDNRFSFARWTLVLLLAGAAIVGCDREESRFASAVQAARRGDVARLRMYLDSGGNVNRRGVPEERDGGFTLLHVAAHEGQNEAAQLLVSNGADVNARDNLGQTPLMAAADGSDQATGLLVCKTLLREGADVQAGDNSGRTALHIAASLGRADILQLLINAGANVYARDRFQSAPIDLVDSMISERRGPEHGKTLQLLLEAGADPECPGPNGTSTVERWRSADDNLLKVYDSWRNRRSMGKTGDH